jgi:hypothetical protein
MSYSEIVIVFFASLFVLAIVICFPLAQIWALNTLFNLNIQYNLSTWFAVLLLNGLLKYQPSVKDTKKIVPFLIEGDQNEI